MVKKQPKKTKQRKKISTKKLLEKCKKNASAQIKKLTQRLVKWLALPWKAPKSESEIEATKDVAISPKSSPISNVTPLTTAKRAEMLTSPSTSAESKVETAETKKASTAVHLRREARVAARGNEGEARVVDNGHARDVTKRRGAHIIRIR
jgi:hypothetical protein